MAIDWHFIGTLEGRNLTGYVPDPEHSMSGVTIATGCDLGAMRFTDLTNLGPGLAQALCAYVGLSGERAVQALKDRPLTITDAEANKIDQTTFANTVEAVRSHYDAAVGPGAWDGLPDEAQTVIASVTFQYGTPWIRTPNFWTAAVAKNWNRVYGCLCHFGDAYQTRHDKEAAYIKSLTESTNV